MSGLPEMIKKAQTGPPKQGKVAQIIGKDQIVLNFGSSSGVAVGTRYRIVALIDVQDPDNPSVKLATLQYIKAELEVTQVLEGVCVAKNAALAPLPLPITFGGLSAFSSPAPLNVDETQIALPPEQMMIRIGDVVVLIPQEAAKKQ